MAKIVVTFNGLVQKELTILKPRLTIGRRPTNDIAIDHLTVSGQHAAIDTTSNGSFVLDLGSTNGTMVNGQPIKKHLLQNEDVIDVGKYKLRFTSEVIPIIGVTPTLPAQTSVTPPNFTTSAKIKVINGSNAGRELHLTKPVTTIGSPGVQVVAITKQGPNYFIAHVDGMSKPKINNIEIDLKPQQIANNDMLDLSGTKMKFIFDNG
ncbi:FHA domain-containing protein [Undibacterium sp. Jales W-56]|uniref:FHA domain-containing protein n=1 Tax=Undibacterium sp. Jales W-56 TaxID=2897325 RepID=UPI0021D3AF03|nr:FHA domain-containing protein [Undibacterium sp. Jales W-56]MCU6434552.1 FHA domain-containing protein [Undibacterium sp. Jales W-56]